MVQKGMLALRHTLILQLPRGWIKPFWTFEFEKNCLKTCKVPKFFWWFLFLWKDNFSLQSQKCICIAKIDTNNSWSMKNMRLKLNNELSIYTSTLTKTIDRYFIFTFITFPPVKVFLKICHPDVRWHHLKIQSKIDLKRKPTLPFDHPRSKYCNFA